jgi:hypothetical protein
MISRTSCAHRQATANPAVHASASSREGSIGPTTPSILASADRLHVMLAGMPHCRICDQELLGSSALPDICAGCATTLGLVPMPPPRRPARPCAKCNGMKFIRAIPREYTAEAYGVGILAVVAPMALTARFTVARHLLFKGSTVSQPKLSQQSCGTLEAYVCAGCGFLEWYCQDPETIPIGPEFMTDAIDYDSPTPYR